MSSVRRVRCYVPGCTNIWESGCVKSFFRFPVDHLRCRKWLEFCGMGEELTAAVKNNKKICIDHFLPNDYYRGKIVRLKLEAIPSIHPPCSSSSSVEPKNSEAPLPPTTSPSTPHTDIEDIRSYGSSIETGESTRSPTGCTSRSLVRTPDYALNSSCTVPTGVVGSPSVTGFNCLDKLGEKYPVVNGWNELLSSKLCRVCGKENKDLIPIYSPQGMEMELQDRIHSYLPILVAEEDLLPLKVCAICVSNLLNFHQFVNICYEANIKLINLLQSAGFRYEDEEDQSSEACKDDISKHITEDKISILADTEIKDEKMDYDDVTFPPSGNDIDDTTQSSHDRKIATKENEISEGYSEVKNECDLETNVEGDIENLNLISEAEDDTEYDNYGDKNYIECQDMDKIQTVKINPSRSSGKKKESNTKFEVIVVKMKNTQDLPHDKQVAIALNLLEQGKAIGISTDQSPEMTEEVKVGTVSDSQPLFETSEIVEKDENSPENEKKNYVRKYCKKVTDGMRTLTLHHIAQQPTKVFYCSECDIVCQSKQTFNEHLNNHKTNDSQPINPIKDETKLKNTKQSAEISNVVKVNIDNSKPSICMKVSDDFKGMDTFLKSKIVKAIKQMASIENMTNETVQKKQRKQHWLCKYCPHVSTSKQDFLLHKSTHPQPTFVCKTCGKNCRTKMRLLIHERTHNQERPFVCEDCGKTFRYQNTLQVHVCAHDKEGRVFACTVCDKAFNNKNSLGIHLKSHSDEVPYLCDVCGKTVKDISNFRLHHRLHLDPDFRQRFMCDECGKQLSTRARLIEHKRLHTNERPLSCQTCDKKFRTRGRLSQHVQIHINARRHSCSICGKRFNRRGNMVSHMKTHNAHKCKICSSSFLSFMDLQSHLHTYAEEEINGVSQSASEKTIEEENGSVYQCGVCHKIFRSDPSLNHHMRIHSGENSYCCEFCGKTFSLKGSLTFHLLNHSDQKPYVCQFCQKDCHTKHSLTVHERCHTGEKPFSCGTCGMSLRSKGNLSQHLAIHSDDRPFHCPHCAKRFKRREALATHLRIHTGERPFPCKICGRRFRQKGDCNKHERSHYKTASLNSDVF